MAKSSAAFNGVFNMERFTYGLSFLLFSYHTAQMTERKAPPEIFNPRLIELRRMRAARRANSFISERCARDAADRLQDINRQFERALIIAPQEFEAQFLSALPDDKTPRNIEWAAPNYDGETISGPFDLIISIMNLHSVNDLPGALIQMRKGLKPDGLFIAAMFGGDTLTEFRSVLYEADDTASGGVSPRIYPFADYSQAAQLLQRTGYALPVVDSDRFHVRYKNWRTLIEDLRDLGETNALAQQSPMRPSIKHIEAAIQSRLDSEAKFSVSFEILWLTGWSPHDSQQKPLAPGSAKMRLADALKSTEKTLKRD